MVGDEAFINNRKVCWALSSACAEVIADCLLCPFEAVKVRIQTSKKGTFPTDFGVAFNKIKLEEGIIFLNQEIKDFSKDLFHYGVDKFLIPLSNLQHLNIQLKNFIKKF